jgi:hypothetical protein
VVCKNGNQSGRYDLNLGYWRKHSSLVDWKTIRRRQQGTCRLLQFILKKKIAWWVVCSLRTSSGVITKRALMPGMRSACCGPLLCSSAVELGVNFTKP